MIDKALLIKVAFRKAHFKLHQTKKFRSSYLLPPPTTIWGMIGNVFGIEQDGLDDFVRNNSISCGSEIIELDGIYTESASMHKWETEKKWYRLTLDDFEFLANPVYILAVSGKESFLESLKAKINNYELARDVYAGISDFMLTYISVEKETRLEKTSEVRGMVPSQDVSRFEPMTSETSYIVFPVVYFNKNFLQGFRAKFVMEKPRIAANGIAIYGVEEIDKLRET